ncbi:M3 family oligoendopeptidase [Thermithiobacillus plumbiphilus]|uniref:M3 family oligoendopeptidase n=1 Tax=Thermithiobacillus plumbiphilus TaxID=1729899 RepID=A0ABU9D590_9PROT
MSNAAEQKTGAEVIRWNLADLYENLDDPKLRDDLTWASQMAEQFGQDYRRDFATLSSQELLKAVETLEAIHSRVGRAGAFLYLNYATHTDDPRYGAALQRFEEDATAIQQHLIFFELAWNALDDDVAARLLEDPALSRYRHHLESARRYRPHLLSEPEEKILAEKNVTGRALWDRLFEETLTDLRFEVKGQQMTEQEVLALLSNPDRDTRRAAADALTTGLQSRLRTLTSVFNAMLADKALDDRLRHYPHWLADRNLSNEASDSMVEALIQAVVAGYPLVARYYRLKARLLGVGQLEDYDRYAPIPGADRRYSWEECREIVLGAFTDFSPEIGGIVREFFDKNWIDAALQPGKRGGAFAHPVTPDAHPYVFVNYTGSVRDVMTVAHELGHGVHQYLARSQGYFNANTPLTTAETASVFGEMLTFERLMRDESDPRRRLGLLCGKIEDTFATVFRQIAMNRFEDAMHTARRSEGELSSERLSELWMETQAPQFEDAVHLREGYRIWWSYIPHFIGSPGYVYAYAFGELLTLALIQRYHEQGQDFVPRYTEMLRLGGSRSPEAVAAVTGVDLKDPDFWSRGLAYMEGMVSEAERLAGG